MTIYEFVNYRDFLRTFVQESRGSARKLSFSQIADAARVQRSYFSKVLHGSAELSPDQGYLIGRFLDLTLAEQEFFLLLVEWSRSAVPERKSQIRSRIDLIRNKMRDSKEYLKTKAVKNPGNFANYYLDPLNQIVHIALTVPRYSTNLSTLARDLHIAPERVLSSVDQLVELGILVKEKQRIRVIQEDLHLPKKSPFFRAWCNQLSLMARQKISNCTKQDPYSFSVVFATSEPLRERIHYRFLDYLKEVEEMTKTSGEATDVFQMNFDLFCWTKD